MVVGVISIVFTLLVLIVTLRKTILRTLRSRWYISKIPGMGERAYPIVGHAATVFAGKPAVIFDKVLAIHKKLIEKLQKLTVVWLGPVPVLWILDPEIAEIILRSSKHIEKSFIYDFLHCWLGTGLLTSKGEKWLQRRKLITPSFHFTILEDFLRIMNEQSRTLIQKLQEFKQTNAKVDLIKCVTMCTLDIICETAMGKSVNAQLEDSEYVEAVTDVTELLQQRMNAPWFWPDFVFDKTANGSKLKRLLKTLHGFSRSVIRDRMDSKTDRKSALNSQKMAFLDVLLEAQTEDGKKLSFSGIQEEVDTFMFEGHDTVSTALMWCLYLLGTHPEIQKKVQAEIDNVIGNSDVINFAMKDLRRLEYLEQVIKEALRLFPSVPLFIRVTSEDCEISGYKVPEGTQVCIFSYTLHHNPNVWKDPEKFDPDRFSKSNSLNRHPFAYIPFSAGPRNCIGQKFAIMEEKVILAQILRHYDVTSFTKPEDLEFVGDLLLRSNNALELLIADRKK